MHSLMHACIHVRSHAGCRLRYRIAHTLAHRANLHLADARQQSPLAKAVAHGLHEVVAALLAAGAPCNRVDPCSGAPPLLQATAAAVDAMLSGGGGGRDPGAVKGAVCDRVATLELLIAHSGVDVDVADGVGDTALHRLVAAGAAALAARLLERRPNLNLQNAGGDTPLHLAMKVPRLDRCWIGS